MDTADTSVPAQKKLVPPSIHTLTSKQCSNLIFTLFFFLNLHDNKSNKFCWLQPSHSAAILNFAKINVLHLLINLHRIFTICERRHLWMQKHFGCGVPMILALTLCNCCPAAHKSYCWIVQPHDNNTDDNNKQKYLFLMLQHADFQFSFRITIMLKLRSCFRLYFHG